MKKGNITDIVIGDLVFIVPNDELAKVVVAEVVRHERINDYYSKLTAKSEEGAEYTLQFPLFFLTKDFILKFNSSDIS